LATLVISLSGLAALAGCNGGRGSAKITFLTLGDGSAMQAFRDIFASFTRQSGNTVELQSLPAISDYERVVRTRFAADDPPEIFWFFSGPNEYITLDAGRNLVELSKEKFVGTLTNTVRDFYTVDGRIYGIPWGSFNAMGVFYNKDVFRRLRLQPPKNWSDFLAVCEKVKQSGITPIYEAAKTAWPVQIFSLAGFQAFVLPAINGMEGVQRLKENKLRITEIPAIRDVFMRQFSLKTRGFYNRDLIAGTYEMQVQAIATGAAAMAFQADWILQDIARSFPDAVDRIGFFPLPPDTGDPSPSLYPPKQIFISRRGPNVRAALTLARFMTSSDSLAAWYGFNPGIPAYTNVRSRLYPGQQEINDFLMAGKGMIQIQLLTAATYVPGYDKICQEFLISGNVERTITLMDERYRADGKAKHLPGF